jgi:probable HAF family extracellular repeat protein
MVQRSLSSLHRRGFGLRKAAWLPGGLFAVTLWASACGGDDAPESGGKAGAAGSSSGGSGGRGGGGRSGAGGPGGEAGQAGASEAGRSAGGETSEGGAGGETATAGTGGGAGKGGSPCVPEYDVVDLGALPPDVNLTATAINADGVVLVSGETRTGVYVDELTDIGVLPNGGMKTFGMSINDAGDVVGQAWFSDIFPHAFLYRGGTLDSIAGDIGETTTSEAIDINNAGDIVVKVDGLWALFSGGIAEPLPQDPTTGGIEPVAINDAGVIVGSMMFDLEAGVHAATLANGDHTDLGTIEDSAGSQGMAINNWGDAVGMVFAGPDFTDPQHAALFSGGDVIDLGVLDGHANSLATGINDQGVIVGGSSSTAGDGNRAFVYACEQMVDLNTRIPDDADAWVLATAYAINEAGQIAGFGNLNGNPTRRAFRLDPR